jgi:tRNA threonylcarbamoyladenosine biosynthesis protein TsaB
VLTLALDTSTRLCSAALGDGGTVWCEVAPGERRQGEELLPMVDRLLARAGASRRDIDRIAFGRGPGAFTGVRVAVAVTQGLAFGLGRPVLPVSSLAALACQAWRRFGSRRVLAALDARMGQIYLGAYDLHAGEAAIAEPLQGEAVGAGEDLPLPAAAALCGIGTGFAVAGAALAKRLGPCLTVRDTAAEPLAEDVLRLALGAAAGDWLPAAGAVPVYLRDQVADPAARQGVAAATAVGQPGAPG